MILETYRIKILSSLKTETIEATNTLYFFMFSNPQSLQAVTEPLKQNRRSSNILLF